MLSYISKELYKRLMGILERDDKEKFLKSFRDHPPPKMTMSLFDKCARYQAKKCLIALIQGELGKPALELYNQHFCDETTPLATVALEFPDPDVIALMLNRGALHHVNIKCHVAQDMHCAPPLSHVLRFLSDEPHIYPWIQGSSLFKLIILLCQWDSKPWLDSARLLAPLTDSVNDIAWTFVMDGDLVPFAALLLVAQEKALVPFDSGLSFRQRIADRIDEYKTKGVIGHEVVEFTSLMDACKLLEIFERAGDNLRLYCSSLHKNVVPDKVLIDVAGIFKKADFLLQPVDLDLKDCYRGCHGLWNASLFKLSDLPSSQTNHVSLPNQTLARGSGAAPYKIPYGQSYIHYKLKTGSVLNFMSSGSQPRLLSTAVGQFDKAGSVVPWKRLAYAAMKLKRGMRV